VGALPETVATPPGTTREQFTESATDMQSQLKAFAQPCKFLQALQDETLMSRSLPPHGCAPPATSRSSLPLRSEKRMECQ